MRTLETCPCDCQYTDHTDSRLVMDKCSYDCNHDWQQGTHASLGRLNKLQSCWVVDGSQQPMLPQMLPCCCQVGEAVHEGVTTQQAAGSRAQAADGPCTLLLSPALASSSQGSLPWPLHQVWHQLTFYGRPACTARQGVVTLAVLPTSAAVLSETPVNRVIAPIAAALSKADLGPPASVHGRFECC